MSWWVTLYAKIVYCKKITGERVGEVHSARSAQNFFDVSSQLAGTSGPGSSCISYRKLMPHPTPYKKLLLKCVFMPFILYYSTLCPSTLFFYVFFSFFPSFFIFRIFQKGGPGPAGPPPWIRLWIVARNPNTCNEPVARRSAIVVE